MSAPRTPRHYSEVERLDVYQERVAALESLLAYYRSGLDFRVPETLHRRLEWTRKCIDHRGQWVWPDASPAE